MIVVRLEGGLGNQMFQYAIGRQISLINKTELKFDLSGFDKNKNVSEVIRKDLRLSIFDSPINIATQQEIGNVRNSKLPLIEKLLYRLQKRKNIPYYRKNELFESQWFKFDRNILKAGKNAYLTGYWQSFHYFHAIRTILLKDFAFKTHPDTKLYPYLNEINKQNSISLHIRRGDYIKNPETFNLHGICSPEYYQAAIKEITAKVNNPVFYIFSDDPEWVKENFAMSFPCIFVLQTPAEHDFFDMYLMSLCKHNIIANSSFSWWGAWLNNNPKKIVIAPKQWMANPGIDTTDLIPTNWIRL